MKFMTIASGSSGNASYVAGSFGALLCDCGISTKRIENALRGAGEDPADLSGIFLTHEHHDHIAGLGVFTRRYKTPVYATEGTIRGIRSAKPDMVDPALFHVIRAGKPLEVCGITVTSAPIPHDANEPVAYTFSEAGKKICLATDLGKRTDELEEFLQEADILLLEANHDVRMLEVGPYPYPLKQRILGNQGHLSNTEAGRLLARVVCPETRYVFLGHLSQKNNYPPLCYETVRGELRGNHYGLTAEDIHLAVASPDEPGELIEI